MASGIWAIGDIAIAAPESLRMQRSDPVDVWVVRVGDRALHYFGGRPLMSAGGYVVIES